MPRFNQQNAAEMQKRSYLARLAREGREREQRVKLAEMPANAHESALKERVFVQLHHLDDMIDQSEDVETLCKLIGAKERLWRLVLPTAGVLKHRNQRRPAFVPRVWDVGPVPE